MDLHLLQHIMVACSIHHTQCFLDLGLDLSTALLFRIKIAGEYSSQVLQLSKAQLIQGDCSLEESFHILYKSLIFNLHDYIRIPSW